MGDHDYVVCLSPRNYQEAQQACSDHGMGLVVLDSQSEENWVLGVVHTYGLIESWIGLTRQPDGGFAWADGTPVDWTHWELGAARRNARIFRLCTDIYLARLDRYQLQYDKCGRV